MYIFEKGEDMALENKLGITDSAELACEEERISKTRAIELFETEFLSSLHSGTFDALSKIHAFLFSDIYDFAGNTWEWTGELYSSYCIGRGGYCSDSGSSYPASYRGYNVSSNTNPYISFRLMLYVM